MKPKVHGHREPLSWYWHMRPRILCFAVFGFSLVLGLVSESQAGFLDDLEKLGREIGEGVEEMIRRVPLPDPEETTGRGQGEPDPPAPQAESQPAAPAYNFDRERVAKAQAMLNDLGYDAGPVDGRYGPRTRAAIRAFESDRKLPRRGDVTDQLLAGLAAEAPAADVVVAEPQSRPPDSDSTAQTMAGAPHSPTSPDLAPSGGPVAPVPGGKLVVPALEGAPIASPPAAPASVQEAAVHGPAAGEGTGSEGLVICSQDSIMPLSARTVSPIATTRAVAGDLDGFLQGQGVRAIIQGVPRLGLLSQYLQIGLAVAFYDRGVSVQPNGAEYGEVAAMLGLGAIASYCKLVLETPVCDKLEPETRTALQCTETQSAGVSATGPDQGTQARARGSDSGMVAPAPAGGRVAPAPAGGRITPAPQGSPAPAAAAPTPPETALASDLDPFAPGGVSIGMNGSDAAAALEVNGYDRSGSRTSEDGKGSRSVKFYTGKSRTNSPRDPVSFIRYKQKHPDLSHSAIDVVNRVSEKIGAQPACDVLKEELAICSWPSPSKAPLVLQIRLTFKRSRTASEIELVVEAVGDLEARMASPTTAAGASASEFDPLAAGGVTIGMGIAAAEATLAANGYRTFSNDCLFITDARHTRQIKLHTGSYGTPYGCEPGKAVRAIHYQQQNIRIETPLADLVDGMNRRLGASAQCARLDEQHAKCHWSSPPGAPLVERVSLSASRMSMDLFIEAVRDLAAHVTVAPPPAPPPLEDQPWWVQELARAEAEAKGGKFTPADGFERLPPAEQARLSREGNYVYDYCKDNQIFAQLHDCRCVASKLVELRIQEGPAAAQDEQEARTRLIAKADGVADACPNKAGAASYGHNSCTANYPHKMSAELQEFCACYADTFATAYMRDPRSFMPHITKLGVFAIQECERQGHRRPLY